MFPIFLVPKTICHGLVPLSVAKGRISTAVMGGTVDDIGEILNQHKAANDSKTIQEEGDLQSEGSSVDPRPQEESSVDPRPQEETSVDPKPQPLEPIVIISRPSLSEEEEAAAEKNVIVVDGSAVEARANEVS